MTEIQKKAIEKINGEKEMTGFSKSIQKPIADTLCRFCRESEKFAQSVLNGKDFKDCITEVAKFTQAEKNKGNISLPDIEVYREATKFYDKTAEIYSTVGIKTEESKIVNLNFASLL